VLSVNKVALGPTRNKLVDSSGPLGVPSAVSLGRSEYPPASRFHLSSGERDSALHGGLVMATQDLTQIAREIVTTYSSGDWTAFKNLMTPDAVYDEIGTQRKIQGPDAIASALQGWKKAMTDSGGTVNKAFASRSRR